MLVLESGANGNCKSNNISTWQLTKQEQSLDKFTPELVKFFDPNNGPVDN